MGEEKKDNGRPDLTEADELAVAMERGHGQLTEGQAEAAADTLEEALILARRLGDDKAEAESAGLLAQAYLRLDQRDEAARLASEALGIAKARRDGDAARHFQQLLLTARSSPEELEMSTTFGDGRAALENSDPKRAAGLLERSLALSEQLGHKQAEGASLLLLAQAYIETERESDAGPLIERAQKLATAVGDEGAAKHAKELSRRIGAESAPASSELEEALQMGQQALAAGEAERGAQHLERALAMARAQAQEVPEATACGLLAQTYIELDRREEATLHAAAAAEIAEKLGHDEAAQHYRMLLAMAAATPESHALAQGLQQGAIALDLHKYEEAAEILEEALRIAEGQSQEVGEALVCGLLARAYTDLGRGEDALTQARRALQISEERGEEEAISHFRELVAEIEGPPESD